MLYQRIDTLSKRFNVSILMALIITLGIMVASAQTDNKPISDDKLEMDSVEVPDLRTDDGRFLSLGEVVMLTLNNNPDIKINKIDVEISSEDVTRAKGIYDPVFRAMGVHSDVEDPTGLEPVSSTGAGPGLTEESTPDDSYRTKRDTIEVGVSQLLPLGTVLELKFVDDRTDIKDSRGQSAYVINPVHFNDAVISLRQPILKDFGPFVTNSGINIAKINDEISAEALRQELILQLANVARTYWDLTFALQNYDARLVSLRLAEDLYRVNLARYKAGVRPITDVLQAQAQVSARESDVITAFLVIEDLQDELIRLMNLGDVSEANWNTPIFPADSPSSVPIELKIDDFVAEAMIKRPEYLQAQMGIDIAKIRERVARNQRLPQLDLFGSYGYSGDGSSSSDAWEDVSDGDFESWSIGVEFIYPIPNRAARAAYRQSQLQTDQAEISRDALRQIIIQQVRTSARRVNTAHVQIGVNETRLQFESEKLRSQEKRYEVGLATAFELLDFQNDYTDAQVNVYRALSEFEKAKVDLAASRGNLLEIVGIELAEENIGIYPTVTEQEN